MDRLDIESDRTVSWPKDHIYEVAMDVPDIEARRLQPTRFQRPATSGQRSWLDRDAEGVMTSTDRA